MNLTQTLRGRQHYQKKLCADGLCSQPTDGNEGHFPVNSTSLLFFLFPLLLLSRFSWPLCTHAHVSAWLWRVNNSVLGKDPLWNAGLPFYLNDESGKLPRWNIYYTKCILLKRKLTRDTPGNYMYLQYVDPVFFFPVAVKHLWVILPTFLTYDWLFEIRHLNFRYVHFCLYSQWAIFTRRFEVTKSVSWFNGDG